VDQDKGYRRTEAEIAAHNAEEMLKTNGKPTNWLIGIELGEFMLEHQESILSFDGPIGVDAVTLHRPVRLVFPTDEEVARFGQVV
jgi:hypothetical protein